MSFLRRVTSADDRLRRKELERKELLEMVLESIANVPKAVERIHTNERLRRALHQEMGAESSLLHRFFESGAALHVQEGATLRGSLSGDNLPRWGRAASEDERRGEAAARPSLGDGYDDPQHSQEEEEQEQDESEDSSSDYGDEYENDLAEAVNQLCMTDESLTAMDNMISDPIGIVHASFGGGSSARISNSPHSSFGLGASPGTTSMDGEPVSALWPRQPNQFAFTQEEDNTVRAEDEVYSEMVSSVCEDETFRDEEGDEEIGETDTQGDEMQEKLFEMDDDEDERGEDGDGDGDTAAFDNDMERFNAEEEEEEEGLVDGMAHYTSKESLANAFVVGSPIEGQVTTFQHDLDGRKTQKADVVHTVDIKKGDDLSDGEENEGSEGSHDDDNDGEPKDYEVFQLCIIREKNRTGFEPNQDWRPRAGALIGNRYKVRNGLIIKNNKEYFDQGVDEIRVLEYIDRNCKVDEKHLVRLLDAFYFREHLIIVTELLRDNLYEFSRLLLQRGVINYFNISRLKKITIEVLEALDTLHSLGLVHCDLKPENILIQNFSACTIKVIDFGSACFTTDELTSYVQSRSYRAPEVSLSPVDQCNLIQHADRATLLTQVILGLLYDTKIDLWSLGCVIAEMYTGEVLFRNDSEQTLLARILATIGASFSRTSCECSAPSTCNHFLHVTADTGPIPASLLANREDLQRQLIDTGLFTVDHMGNGVLAASLQLPPLEAARDADNQETKRSVTADGVGFYTSDKWAKFYPNQEVAVVTSVGQPPIPPEGERWDACNWPNGWGLTDRCGVAGYVPLRHGHRRDQLRREASPPGEEAPNGCVGAASRCAD
ncbi:unnamed protein product [Phytophthora fragariaefolia]|uniref:Unnamed protein product n=1 Tax=Phytophthora fragariaefolia TaxID=1490495 RepID=A0A9W6U6K9_9STRA|nr:unnamed protein product [Phytophthora fragariaefolia]